MDDLKAQSSIVDRKEDKQSARFSSNLSKQLYSEIHKQKAKWTDDLFPAEERSLYSGKTEFSGHKGPYSVPSGLSVIFIFFLSFFIGICKKQIYITIDIS